MTNILYNPALNQYRFKRQ